MMSAARPAQASPRIASNSISQVTMTVMVTATKPAAAVPVTALPTSVTPKAATPKAATPETVTPATVTPRPAARHVVQPGDTLSGIAAAAGVAGGWPALYAANRHAIGPDPNVIRSRHLACAAPGAPGPRQRRPDEAQRLVPCGGVDPVGRDRVPLRAEEVLVLHGAADRGVHLGVVIHEVGQPQLLAVPPLLAPLPAKAGLPARHARPRP